MENLNRSTQRKELPRGSYKAVASMNTKIYLVIEYMAKAGEKGITQWDAIRIAKHTRLSALVHALRARGITIHSRDEMGKDGTRYTRYWFDSDVDTEKLLSSRRKKSAETEQGINA